MKQDVDLSPLEPRSSSGLVSDSLRRVIALGGWSPGERLPSERQMAETFRVSRDSVREAIRRLRAEGLVETHVGRLGGTFVAESLRKHLRLAVELLAYRQDIASSYEFRRILEPEAARLAADRASPEQTDLIAAITEETAWSVRSYRAIDSRFHSAVAEASGNPLLVDAITWARATFFVWYDQIYSHDDWDSLPLEKRDHGLVHRPISDAISCGDGDAASALMRAHLERTEHAMMDRLDKLAQKTGGETAS